jgi:hypothetical protein
VKEWNIMHIEHFLRGAETMVNEASETSPEVSETSGGGGWRKVHVLLDLAEYMVNELKRDNTTNMDLRYFAKKA